MISISVAGIRLALAATVLAPAGGLVSLSKPLPPASIERPLTSAPASGEEVIRAMHAKYEKSWYRTLSFTQKTTRRTPADTMAIETWRERAMVPGYLRIDVEGPRNLTIVYGADSVFVWRGDSTLNRAAARNILMVIGFDVYRQPPETTLAVLKAEHFPMTPVREDTWKGKPVYVIGAAAGDLRSHQLWIEKDRLLFVRAIQPDERDSTKTLDMRFDNYVKVPAGWLSETVELYRDGKLFQREEYSDVKTNIPVDPKIFVPPTAH
jgi:hypothetical protein